MLSPVSRHSAARAGPMSGGSSAASMTEGTPTRISGSPMSASVAAVRISHAMASSNPPPRQWPFIMQTVGNGASWTVWMASCSVAMNALASRAVRSRRNWSCMPAVIARPLPVSTAARTRGSSRSSSKAALIPRIISGTMRLSGGRSRVTQAQPPRCSTRTNPKSAIGQAPLISSSPPRARRLRLLGPVSARTSIPIHGRVHRLRPQIEPSRQVHRPGEAEPAQIVGHRRAPDPVVAVDDDLLLGVQLLGAELELLDGNVRGVLETAEPGLPLVAHVEQDDGPLLLEPCPELVGTDLLWHRSTSAELTISSSSVQNRARRLVGQEDGGFRRHLDLDMV